MIKNRHLMTTLLMCLTLLSATSRAADEEPILQEGTFKGSKDAYPDRDILFKIAVSLCTELNPQKTVSSLKISPLIQHYLSKAPDSTKTTYDSSGWTVDLFFPKPSPGFLRLLKGDSFFMLDYRQNEKTIESVANISLGRDCRLSEARFTYYNASLRPMLRVKFNSSYQQIQSLVMEEAMKEVPQKNPPTKKVVRIGIIDTGIDYNHPALISKSRPMLGLDLITKGRPPYDYTNSIQNEQMGKHFSHGTAVADIATRNIDALIIPVRTSNQPSLDGAAVEYLAKKDVRIVNISQGTSDKSEWLPLKTAMQKHPEILFIVSAGNTAQDIDKEPFYPSEFNLPNMLAVASVNTQGQLSEFSNYGAKHVHLAAIGENVSAALAGGGQWTVNGTSFAAPVVTNIAAQLLIEDPSLKSQELRSLLIQLAKPVEGLKGKVQYGVLGME
ncbi:MAG TPA: S8 family serine peptidase [Pseudobdellovibrionaceae bacterium]|jgi:hypothetical protein